MDKGDITNQTKHKKICCVNDMPGVGKIALSAMIPFLSVNGIDVTSLPTALVSNTLDFGKFNILDTTEYMDKTIDIWKSLEFKFDCISIGFMVNPKQIDIIERLINNHDKEKLVVVVDPIMGDEGKLYNGMTEFNVQIMRKLTAYADILIPNFTEACYLVDGICSKKNLTSTEAKDLVKQLRILGAKSVVITSSFVNNKNCVIGYDHLNDYFFIIEFDLVDVRFPGTGDIFSSILISDVLNGNCLYESTKHAMEVTRDIILYNINKDEKFFGVDIEKYISEGKL